MNDRTGFLAVCADSLTEMCLYYAAGGILIMGSRWGVHLFWLLLWAAVCAAVFALVLKRARPASALVVLTAALFLAGFGLFWMTSDTPMRFGYGLVLTVGAGMAAGLPLYFTLHRPKITSHLAQLDILIAGLLLLLLTKDVMGIDDGTVVLAAAVVFLDIAAAVGLRMTEDGSAADRDVTRASLTALAAALVTSLIVWLLSMLFSRSGAVTGGLLHAIGSLFAAMGSGLESILARIAALFARQEHYEAIDPGEVMPSLADAELSDTGMALSVNTTAVTIVLCVLAAAIFTAAVLLLRHRRISRAADISLTASSSQIIRTGGTAGILWQQLRQAVTFRWTAFKNRATPAGLLVILERSAKRARCPREKGETMRSFLTRIDPSGGLDTLADALDRQYYGMADSGLSRSDCRALRRYIRRSLTLLKQRNSLEKEIAV